jgi:hypothetical protein
VKKSSIAIALCCAFLCTPVSAKTFVSVLYPLFGPVAALGLVDLVSELKSMPDVEVVSYLHQAWPRLVDDINRQPSGTLAGPWPSPKPALTTARPLKRI